MLENADPVLKNALSNIENLLRIEIKETIKAEMHNRKQKTAPVQSTAYSVRTATYFGIRIILHGRWKRHR